MEHVTHHIKTIEELGAVATPENVEALLADLSISLRTHVAFNNFLKIGCEEQKVEHIPLKWQVFGWIDDGKNEIQEFKVTDKEGNELNIKRQDP